MAFSVQLEAYLKEAGLSGSRLAADLGCSRSVVSRWLKGETVPRPDSERFIRLCQVLAGALGVSEQEVQQAFALSAGADDCAAAVRNLNVLVQTFHLNCHSLSRHLHFDASYLSRIRSGSRRPAKPEAFCAGVADYIAGCRMQLGLDNLAHLLGCDAAELDSHGICARKVLEWLCAGEAVQENPVTGFLEHLDGFDLQEYGSGGQGAFPDLSIPEQKEYAGLSGFMEAELAWMQATLQGPKEPLVFYTDTPMEAMSKDLDFPRQWVGGLAMLAQKGFQMNIIHSVERSFPEMLLGLQGWIPLYMTGIVSPWYLKDYANPYFHTFLRSSASAGISGEAIVGHHKDGRYRFSTRPEDVAYFRKRASQLLAKASPLMDIYRSGRAEAFQSFLDQHDQKSGTFVSVLPVPPLYTLSADLLEQILDRNCLEEKEKAAIRQLHQKAVTRHQRMCQDNEVTDFIPFLSGEEFAQSPAALSLADLFLEKEVFYSYEDYLAHWGLTVSSGSYHVEQAQDFPFRNIRIRMLMGEYALVSRHKSPAIHFVIRHPRLREAIESLART